MERIKIHHDKFIKTARNISYLAKFERDNKRLTKGLMKILRDEKICGN